MLKWGVIALQKKPNTLERSKSIKNLDNLANFKFGIYGSRLDGSYQSIYADEIHFGTECEDLLIENIGYYCSNLKKQTINETFPIFTEDRVAYYTRG